jgi:predicted DsbA family dithiol-disulfide isomerase
MQGEAVVHLDIYTDVAWPWCHLAKVRLDNAKQQLSETRPAAKIVVHYYPFMIDPGTQPDGEPYDDYNRRRWGGDGWTRSMKQMGRKEGAPYNNWVTWPNTTHCSRLLLLA